MAMTKESIALVGAGLVGRAWAIVFARAGHGVRMYDNNPATLHASLEGLLPSLSELQEFGLIDETPEAIRARIGAAATLSDALAGADYVQESTQENLTAKRAVFAAMDRLAAPGTILASSTSTIMTSSFAADLPGRARCLVAHPVNPPSVIPLVEVSPAAFTDTAVTERTLDLMRRVGQKPILVKKETQGFILNRLQWVLMSEAFRLVEDGYIGVEDLDQTLKEGLGLRWSFIGPFEVGDLNAPDGVADYARRFGEMIYEIDSSAQSQPRRLSESLLADIEAQRRELLPKSELGSRSRWRDRRLMALAAHKKAQEARK